MKGKLTMKTSESNKATEHTCPDCGGENFGVHDGVPVTSGGWHGGQHYSWGQYAGVHMPRCDGKRCEDCGHEVEVDADWDDE
jgi:hypothetical protein